MERISAGFFQQKGDQIGPIFRVTMLRFSKRVEYGLMALLELDASANGGYLPVKDIAERHEIPQDLLGKVMQALTRAGYVASTKGMHGGYRLVQPLERVTVGKVIESLEGPVYLTPCCDDSKSCRQQDHCNIRRPILRVQEHLLRYISQLTLAEFREGDPRPIEMNIGEQCV